MSTTCRFEFIKPVLGMAVVLGISQVVATDGSGWQSSVYHRLSRLMAQGGSRPRYISQVVPTDGSGWQSSSVYLTGRPD